VIQNGSDGEDRSAKASLSMGGETANYRKSSATIFSSFSEY